MYLSFEYGDTTIHFEMSYRRRKTISISVEAPDRVIVVAPEGLSEDEIISRVKSKGRWITRKLYEVRNIKTVSSKKEFVNGESFMYLGSNYPFQLKMDTSIKTPEVKLCQGKLIALAPNADKDPIKNAMEAWYRSKAQEYIKERIKYYQPQIGVKPDRIRIKEQKKRWGSCSSIGNLNFNWKAVMAPAPVLDYIIVHELCHLVHLNHSREFWNLVASILPDYKERQQWLKENGAGLSLS